LPHHSPEDHQDESAQHPGDPVHPSPTHGLPSF
jgi:hypothetical protein